MLSRGIAANTLFDFIMFSWTLSTCVEQYVAQMVRNF